MNNEYDKLSIALWEFLESVQELSEYRRQDLHDRLMAEIDEQTEASVTE